MTNPTREQFVEELFMLLVFSGLIYDDDDECDIKDRLRRGNLSGIWRLFTGSEEVPEPAENHKWDDCDDEDEEEEND